MASYNIIFIRVFVSHVRKLLDWMEQKPSVLTALNWSVILSHVDLLVGSIYVIVELRSETQKMLFFIVFFSSTFCADTARDPASFSSASSITVRGQKQCFARRDSFETRKSGG